MIIQLIITSIFIIKYDFYPIQIMSIFATPLIIYLEPYDFKINRFIQYSFYPIHMIILWGINFIIPNLK